MVLEYVAPLSGLVALILACWLALRVKKLPSGTPKMAEISGFIHKGALSYLNRQYRVLVVFVAVMALILGYLISVPTAAVFVFGAALSALAGNIGMRIATQSNAKTAQACTKGISAGLKVAFSSGAVMGMTVVGFGILGILVSYHFFPDPEILFGFGFGASSIALFARVGGGIYTKAADVGADLVGKVEKGIPEDDPRNPAVIADNVGDNVGDVAGMGADLYESYVESIIAAMSIGAVISAFSGILLPLVIAGAGIFSSIIGLVLVMVISGNKPENAMNTGIFASALVMGLVSYFLVQNITGQLGIFYSIVSGLVAGIVIGLSTEYYTSSHMEPAIDIAEAAQTGAGTNVIIGFATGMESCAIPVLATSAAILVSYYFAGLYGVAMAAVGMLSTLGITLATDCYGPVADNAAGITEMAGMGKRIRGRAEELDAVGNTTAAIGKGFAIGSAALTSVALFSVYGQKVGVSSIDVTNPYVMVGMFIGALLPFVFSSLTMKSVGKTAFEMVKEVRRQFRTIRGLMQGKAHAHYERCIAISTHAAIKQMILPGLLAVVTPIAVGLVLGAAALGGLLAGSIITGFLLALTMSNSGGAWDNAKKYIEEGHLKGKGSSVHKAAIVGDTFGDPLKDCSAPSLNILIKLVSIIALIFASLFF
jgi:K(+)-stimulated pyrophosphate-energized sodium pump